MAAVDFFLKIDGIDGESKDSDHADEIDLQSWSWGVAQSGTFSGGGGGGAGKAAAQDFHFVMTINKASAKLMQACATGQHIDTALLTCRKAGEDQQEYLKITLSHLIVSNFQTGGSCSGNLLPTDQISLNFAKIEYAYAPQNDKGDLDEPLNAGYDFKANKKV